MGLVWWHPDRRAERGKKKKKRWKKKREISPIPICVNPPPAGERKNSSTPAERTSSSFFPFYFFLFKINILASIFIIIFFLSFPSILAFLITTLTHSYIARAPAQPTTTTTATTGSRSIPRILSPPPLRYLFFRFFLFLRTRWPIFHTHLTDPNSQTTMKFSSFFFIRRRWRKE